MEEQIIEENPVKGLETTQKTPNDYRFDPDYHRFAELLGVDKFKRDDLDVAQKLSFVYDWAKENVGSDNSTEIKEYITDYIRELGVQFRGLELVKHLYQMTRLNEEGRRMRQDHQRIEKEPIEKIKGLEKNTIEKEITEGMRDVKRHVKRRVKTEMTKTIKQGIQEAIRKAGEYG